MTPTLWDVVVIGGGAAGIAVAASILKRKPHLSVAIVEPSDRHFYQPAWTLVGGGCFNPANTCKATSKLIPNGAKWLRSRVTEMEPTHNRVTLEDGQSLNYQFLVVAPGLELNLGAIEGLESSLGKHGVTSNYLFELASYTWECVRNLHCGRALCTQPPMPIKCSGAPQKAMYLSCHHWEETGTLGNIDVQFHNAGAVLFGVADFVPPLMEYVKRYNANLNFNSTLIAVDGPAREATFRRTNGDGTNTDRHAACGTAATGPTVCARQRAGQRGRLGRRGRSHPAAPPFCQCIQPGRCLRGQQCQNRRRRAKAGAGGGRDPLRGAGKSCADSSL